MKNVLILVVVAILLSLAFTGKVWADQWSPTEDWGPQSENYCPDWGRTVFYEYTDSAYNLYVSPQARFRFTQDAIDAIKNYYSQHLPPLYYTFDISTFPYNTTVSALNTTMYYSTLPSPHFDRDDDPEESGGNGYYDETEVTCLSSNSILADTDYRFDSRFRVYFTSPKTTFTFNSQMSFWAGSEYDTWPGMSKEHKSRDYPWY